MNVFWFVNVIPRYFNVETINEMDNLSRCRDLSCIRVITQARTYTHTHTHTLLFTDFYTSLFTKNYNTTCVFLYLWYFKFSVNKLSAHSKSWSVPFDFSPNWLSRVFHMEYSKLSWKHMAIKGLTSNHSEYEIGRTNFTCNSYDFLILRSKQPFRFPDCM